ncbi:MAG: hypothetical protein DRN83_04250 [Hadesarchaea archaeon]|nr:MAG: hypothetical protein DRN83_04250 [Hadesarchaea archaeon]
MNRKVFSNAVILEGDDLELTRGYIVVRNGIVEKIAEGSPPGRATDIKHGFILPPFINAHTHIVDSIAKERYLGKTQSKVVGPSGEKFKALNSSPLKDIVTSTTATLRDMLRTGTLAHCDFREGGIAGIGIIKQLPHTPVKSIVLGRPTDLKELSKVLDRGDGIGISSLDAFEPDELLEIARQTRHAKKLLAVHVAETKKAQEISMRYSGWSEVKLAVELGSSFVVHATHATKQDFALLRKKRVPVVFCPRANSLLSVGSPPLHMALMAGVRFCLGTDNAMVCQPNMFEELSFAWASLRGSTPSAGSEEARSLLRAATVEPIKLFDLPWTPIKEGERATFMILARGDNLLNISDVYAGLVNRARPDNIRTIYVNGKLIS